MPADTPDHSPETLEAVFALSKAAHQRGDMVRAIRHADRLLELSRHSAPAVVWSILLRLESRQWLQAIELGRCELDKSPEISGLVGQAYKALGKLAEAQPFFERAALEQPENATWHYENASTLSHLHRAFESMQSLRTAVRLRPVQRALQILAGEELSFGDPDAALIAAEQALHWDPNDDTMHVAAARSLMAADRYEEADRRWSLALSLAGDPQSVRLQRAVALIRHGELDRGIESLDQMIESDPDYAPAYVRLAMSKRMAERDWHLVERMEAFAKSQAIDDDERVRMEFALGKAHEDLARYEAAMRHFDEANRLQYRPIGESGGFDRTAYEADMELRRRVYNRREIAAASQGDPTELPIFVLGMIRSGTTLAEQILSSHPWVSGAGEQDFWVNADHRLIDHARERPDLRILHRSGSTYLRLLSGFATNGTKRVVDKQPGNLILAGALHLAFPNARIIHMRRQAADTAISIWTTHFRTGTRFVNEKGNIAFACRQHEKLMRHWRDILPPDRFLDVSYESLITDRENVTRALLDFCGLPWNDACLFPERNKKFVITPSFWQVRQPVYSTSIGRWKNYEPWLGEFRELLEPS